MQSSDSAINLPNNGWRPRIDQLPVWSHLEHGGKRAIIIGHRRWGKDEIALHRTACAAFERVGGYWHMLPEAAQARKAIWEAINPHTGIRRIDEAFPPEIRETTLAHEMFIRFRNGSTWQVVGSDNYNSLVGAPPVGVVMSEWALAKPQAWAYLRPILRENGGWAMFVTTSRGKNHAYTMYEGAKNDPDWFTALLRADQTGVFTPEQLEQERREYIRDFGEAEGTAMFEQEYLCSFEGAVPGAIYASELRAAREEKRVTKVPYERGYQVHAWWDIGIGDATSIWLGQIIGREVRMIDYYEESGVGAHVHAAALQAKGYLFGEMYLPHDAQSREKGSGKTYIEIMRGLMPNITWKITPKLDLESGINAARMAFPTVYFDEQKCKAGIDALGNYRRDYSQKLADFLPQPVHDWSSHGSDAFRYFAVSRDLIAGPRTFAKITRPRRHVV